MKMYLDLNFIVLYWWTGLLHERLTMLEVSVQSEECYNYFNGFSTLLRGLQNTIVKDKHLLGL